jgi:hypothetical protein
VSGWFGTGWIGRHQEQETSAAVTATAVHQRPGARQNDPVTDDHSEAASLQQQRPKPS